jgi:arginyl-tRNA synthetase
VARFLGHTVITDNHIGDWGTQFGKVIYGWKHLRNDDALTQDPIAELVRLYRDVNALEAGDAGIAREAREELVKLQARDPENLAIWQTCVDLSWKEFQKLYDLLDVRFDEHLGESAYNEALAPLCEKLVELGLAEVSDGALCVFFRDIPDMEERPAIVRKADGGFLYATTDLATIEYRIKRWHPDEIWYVVGAPQSLHFQQIFEIARRMGLTVTMRHIPFGSILGEDRKIMKTRSGENIGLSEVLKEALTRAEVIIREKNPEMPDSEISNIAHDVGIGAVKYAELSQHRMTDYVFSWDKMLAFHGNTAPYLQNAFVRVRSIFRRAGGESSLAPIHTNHPAERTLGMKLARYPEILPILLEDFRPNLLANYLFELAECFHGFYEACPVLKSEGSERASRLALCELTSRVLAHGLSLMGIQCPQRM